MSEIHYTHTQSSSGQDIAKAGKSQPVVETIEGLIERVEILGKHLHEALQPVMSQYATLSEGDVPRPEPASHLRGRLERLAEAIGNVERIIGQIDL